MTFNPLSPEEEQEIVKACAVFNLVPPFTLDEAKRRYRELAKVYHPDSKPLGNQTVFAEMSKSFDVIERNYDLLQTGKFGFLRGNSSLGKSALEELRELRIQIAEKDRRIHAFNEETKVLRSAVKGKDIAGSLNKILWTAITAGLVIIAFIVGMTKGFEIPEGSFDSQSPSVFQLELISQKDNSTTQTVHYTFAEKWANVSINNGKVKIINKKATFETSPTLRVETTITSSSTSIH